MNNEGDDKKVRKERVNYIIENDSYCASTVNMPIVVQADSFEEMKRRVKIMAQSWLSFMKDTVDNEFFDFVQGDYMSIAVMKWWESIKEDQRGCAITWQKSLRDIDERKRWDFFKVQSNPSAITDIYNFFR